MLRSTHRDGVDIFILGELNNRSTRRHGWPTDGHLDATIVAVNGDLPVHGEVRGEGFVWLELDKLMMYSCYCSPNVGTQFFNTYLQDLGEDVLKH